MVGFWVRGLKAWKSLVFVLLFSLVSCMVVDNSFEGDKGIYSAPADPGDDTDTRAAAMAVLTSYNCGSCHGATQAPYFNSATADSVFIDEGLVVAGNPTASRLIRSLRTSACADSGGNCDMPAAPYFATLTDEDYQKLVDWINEL